LLVRVLSFLRIKGRILSTHTCVLPKKWRNIWASFPALYISLLEFLPDLMLPDEKVRAHETKICAYFRGVYKIGKAYTWMNSWYTGKQEKFKIVSCNTEAANGCIFHTMEFKPQVLGPCFCRHKLLTSCAIFSSAFLEEIMVVPEGRESDFEIASESVHLPHLRNLVL
jgi:hypothetical protein